MKKYILIPLCISLLFIGCNSKAIDELDDLKNENAILVKKNQDNKTEIDNLNKVIAELNADKKVLESQVEDLNNQISFVLSDLDDIEFLLKAGLYNDRIYEKHTINFCFVSKADSVPVYDCPEESKVVYTIQNGDKVESNLFVVVQGAYRYFAFVKVNDEIKGFVKVLYNPYENGKLSIIDNIKVEDKEVAVLSLEDSFAVSDFCDVKENPCDSSATLYQTTHEEGGTYYKSISITSDYKWIKMKINDYTGWVHFSAVSKDIGGPSLKTAEWYLLDIFEPFEI